MAYSNEALKEIKFFIRVSEEEVTRYKLDKIGISRDLYSVREFPPSAIRKDYVVEMNDKNFIYCINCNHLKASHEVHSISGGIMPSHTCYGLTDNQNCNCKKFISVNGTDSL